MIGRGALVASGIALALALTARGAAAQSDRTGRSSRAEDSDRGRRSESPARPSGAVSFDDFRIVYERNIFDSSRRERRERGPEPSAPPPPPPRRLSLVGAFINRDFSGGRAIALFTGSESEFNITAKPGDTIAGFRVEDIRTDGVRLASDAQTLTLAVGKSLIQRGDANWEVGAAEPSERSEGARTPDSSGGSIPSGASAPSAAGAGADDVLKRLMEKRRQEMGQ